MKYLWIVVLILTMTGCKVGPVYVPPNTPMPDSYTEDIQGETFEPEDEDLVQWWRIFNDPFLDDLLEEATEGSFDYQIALEQVYAARANWWVQVTMILPQVDFDYTATRFRTSSSFAAASLTPTVPRIQDFFQLGFDAIWELDIWGKFRSNAMAAYDTWEATKEEAHAVKIVILSEVANTYAIINSFQEQVDLGTQIVALDRELLELSEERFMAGLANEQEVQAATAAFESDSSTLMVLETTLKVNIYSLAILLGRQPETLLADFQEQRPIPYSSGRIPAGLPADLLRRRPDIRAAERNLASTTELVDVAVANLFPTLSLTGSSSSFAANPLQGANIGFSSDTAGKLFKSASRIWGIGAFVDWPVIDFGQRLSLVDEQQSIRREAYLSYQKTVIGALEEVEQALTMYFNDEERVGNLTREVVANRRVYDLTFDQFQSGLMNYTQVLEAKEIWLISLNNLTLVQQSLATDLIAVYKALGGEW